ncbi:serine/threonine-protein kinase [Nocardiopsis coralliicola]
MLGIGLVRIPPVPARDPASAVLADPVVAEKNRFCGHCQEPVGRTRDGRPGRTEGYCRHCGTEFSFVPKLNPGDIVAGQYEVLGCLAHGGLGWIYLARDHNVSDRWVVLKGLLNSGDAEAHRTAAAERAFLAEVEHPNIVSIFNFVQHPDPRTRIRAGHIVMEYVGGKSLRDLIVDLRAQDEGACLPVPQVLAYALEVLRALGYLHSKGLLYCDFKPDNVIQSEEQIKLIDLGGVRRMSDGDTPVFTTPGYRVPEEELRTLGPTVGSDLYTVGRTMAVLSMRFSFTREHPHTLPDPQREPLLDRHPSFARLLQRATHADPAARFASAGAMADQITGVLREVLSEESGTPHPAPSELFGPDRFLTGAPAPLRSGADPDTLLAVPAPADAAAALPVPLADPEDPAAALLAGLAAVRPEEAAATLEPVAGSSVEAEFALARALVLTGDTAGARQRMDRLAARQAAERQAQAAAEPADWRPQWYLALAALAEGAWTEAAHRFDALYAHLPGEAAPKLGLAAAWEGRGRTEEAARLLETVWATDRSAVGAAFALARIRVAQGRRGDAVAALDAVPDTAALHTAAQCTAVAALLAGDPSGLPAADVAEAGARTERAGAGGEQEARLRVRVLEAALARGAAAAAPKGQSAQSTLSALSAQSTPAGPPAPRNPGTAGAVQPEPLLGDSMDEDGLRRNLEAVYRSLARSATDPDERLALVDRANARRPRTWI